MELRRKLATSARSLLMWYRKGSMQQFSTVSKKRKQAGFSLLELLVVVSIIGILIAVAAAAYSTAQKKGRDAKRRGDVRAIQSAMEQYYADNDSSYEDASTANNCSVELVGVMPGGMPVDPKGDPYTCTNAADAYCVCTTALEGGNGNSATADCTTLTAPVSTNNYYCLKNLQ